MTLYRVDLYNLKNGIEKLYIISKGHPDRIEMKVYAMDDSEFGSEIYVKEEEFRKYELDNYIEAGVYYLFEKLEDAISKSIELLEYHLDIRKEFLKEIKRS
jgi:hypothetical protein